MSETTETKPDSETTDDVSLTDVTISVETTVVSVTSIGEPEAHPEAALEELKTEVLTAVRGAITGVMSRHQPAVPGPDLDFDFHLREAPASEPAEALPDFQQALSEAIAATDPPAEAGVPTEEPPSESAPQPFEEVALSGDEPGVSEEPALADAPQDGPALPDLDPELKVAVAEGMPLSLVPSASPPVPVTVPLPLPQRSHWPAWTTAALLSLSGIAVGAGAATLLIEPGAVGTLRDRLSDSLQAVVGSGAPPPVAETGAGKPASAPMATASEADPAAASSEPSTTLVPAQPATAVTAPATEPAVAVAATPEVEPLADAIRVASAGDAAAFAHRMRKPLSAGAIALTSAGSAPSEALAALPPQVATPASATGGETSAVPAGLAKAPPQKAKVAVATAETAPAPEAADEGSASTTATAPLSAMARANAALAKGDVDTARLLLQAESEAGQVEGMLLLARSYDPAYLTTLGIDATKGKREVAEKLYRAWYDRSVKLGLVSEGVNIDRLLRAMARAKP